MAATTQDQNSKVTPHVQQHLQLNQQHMTHQSQGDTGALHNDYTEHAVVEDRLYAQPPVGRQAILERSRKLHPRIDIPDRSGR